MNESCVCLISHTLVALLTDDLQRELRMGLIVFCTAHRILLYKKSSLIFIALSLIEKERKIISH